MHPCKGGYSPPYTPLYADHECPTCNADTAVVTVTMLMPLLGAVLRSLCGLCIVYQLVLGVVMAEHTMRQP